MDIVCNEEQLKGPDDGVCLRLALIVCVTYTYSTYADIFAIEKFYFTHQPVVALNCLNPVIRS